MTHVVMGNSEFEFLDAMRYALCAMQVIEEGRFYAKTRKRSGNSQEEKTEERAEKASDQGPSRVIRRRERSGKEKTQKNSSERRGNESTQGKRNRPQRSCLGSTPGSGRAINPRRPMIGGDQGRQVYLDFIGVKYHVPFCICLISRTSCEKSSFRLTKSISLVFTTRRGVRS